MSAQLPQGYRFWWNYDGSVFKKEKLEKIFWDLFYSVTEIGFHKKILPLSLILNMNHQTVFNQNTVQNNLLWPILYQVIANAEVTQHKLRKC